MKKLLVALFLIAGLIWLLLARNSGPSVEEVQRIGIQAFIEHDMLTSCTLSVLGDAKLKSCTPKESNQESIELLYSDSGRFLGRITRLSGKVTNQIRIEYNHENHSFKVKKQQGGLGKLNVFRVCHQQRVSDSQLSYQCEQYVDGEPLVKPPITYEYDAYSGELLVKIPAPYGAKKTRYIYNREGQLIAHHAVANIVVRQGTKSLEVKTEHGHFFSYHYLKNEVRESYNHTLDTRNSLHKLLRLVGDNPPEFGWAAIIDHDENSYNPKWQSFSDSPYLQVLKRDGHGTPQVIKRPGEWQARKFSGKYHEGSLEQEERALVYRKQAF